MRKDKDLKGILKSCKTFYLQYIQEEKMRRHQDKLRGTENSQKTMWSIINQETAGNQKRHSQPPRDELNKYFVTVGNRPAAVPTYPTKNQPSVTKSFFLEPVTPQEVEQIINNLKPKTSMDVHYLHTKLLKMTNKWIKEPLADIINLCFEKSTVPRDMKIAKITPIYKKGDPSQCSNYRPVAVLPVFSKVFEAALLSRLSGFVQSQEILSDSQYGFRKGRSTIDAVRALLDTVWEAMEAGEEAEATMCDLSKAFDCIQHEKLLQKLETCGIRGGPLKLMQSYLQHRTQMVYGDGELSGALHNGCGVVQGSLMGPVMFCLFINDLPKNISTKTILFADDTTLVTTHSNRAILTARSENALEEAKTWFQAHGLTLNETKTTTMNFTSTRYRETTKTSEKLLGIVLDTRLTWVNHTEHLVKALSTAIYAIRRVRQVVGKEAALAAYHAMFHSRMSYGIELWGESAHASKIFLLQKRAVRAIERVDQTTTCKPLFKNLKIMTLPATYIYQQILRAKGEAPTYQNRGETIQRSLRNCTEISIPFHRINTTSNQHRHLQLFNALPEEWRWKTKRKLQMDLKQFLAKEAPYTVIEFCYIMSNM